MTEEILIFSNTNSKVRKCCVFELKIVVASAICPASPKLAATIAIYERECNEGPQEEHDRILNDTLKILSTKGFLRTKGHILASYEQNKQGICCLHKHGE